MAGNLTAMIAAIFSGSAVSTDPYFNLTTLLLSTTATNGQQNNTFQDSSTNNFTITRNPATGPNAPTQGTFSPFSQTGWGNYFDGAGDFINTPATGQFAPTGDFTIRFWFYLTSLAAINSLVGNYSSTATTDWLLQVSTTGVLEVYTNGSSLRLSQSGITANRWYYVTVTRTGTTITGQLDGTNFNTTATYTQSGTFGTATKSIYMGMRTGSTNPLTGYLSNVSLVDGSVIQTVPTAPLTDVTGTKLLTCQSNRFVDNSSSPNTLTIGGNTSVVPFSPFNPTSAWSASTVGGSGYFDGTGDYLSNTPSSSAFSFGTGDFTIEYWVYINSGTNNGIFQLSDTAGGLKPSQANSLAMNIFTNNSVSIYANGTSYQAPNNTLPYNSWTHFAIVRSSNVTKLYANGSLITSIGSSGSITDNTNYTGLYVAIGGYYSTAYLMTGYISNFRIVKGTAVYTGNFTPPTAPLTAITNTSLLLNFTNSGIYDATAKNVLETVGNAQVSTTQSKWSPTSMYFDGTGDYLTNNNASNPLISLGSGDFTVEGWIYANTVAGERGFIQISDTAGGLKTSYTTGIHFALGLSPYRLNFNAGGTDVSSGSTYIAINTWYHVAATRSSGSVRLFINGTLVGGPTTITTNLTGQYICIGGYYSTSFLWNGYIQDLRIIKGYARYTANFTAPTAAFPVQ